MKNYILFALTLILISYGCSSNQNNLNQPKKIKPHALVVGDKIDSLNNVYVFYNGAIDHVGQRNVSSDGYNIGLKYQCVEFVKRYYYQYFKHKMPDSYGNAKDFFDPQVKDGKLNAKRALIQFQNPSKTKPAVNDLLILDASATNEFGHVAIVSKVEDDALQIIQQNPGPTSPSRANFSIIQVGHRYMVGNLRVLGWLRMKD